MPPRSAYLSNVAQRCPKADCDETRAGALTRGVNGNAVGRFAPDPQLSLQL
jgi:hypothetical protein